MRFNLSKTVILPKNTPQGRCEISVISKDDVNHDFWFMVTGLDENGQVTDSGSIKINSRRWKENSVKIKLGNTKAIRVNMSYEGDSTSRQQVWIDQILIKAGSRNITQSNYFSDNPNDSLKIKKSLNKKYLVPLTTENDSTMLSGIKTLRDKKIIGIGECTHGSNTIKKAEYQFIENLITNHLCKLVLLELSIDKTLCWNLYIQGKIPPNYSKVIQDDLRNNFIDHELFMHFLDWLKNYNMHSVSKVYISGVDNPNPEVKNLYLFNFYLALLGKEKGAYYLKKTADQNYTELTEHSLLDTALQNRLGKKNFECYLSVLRNEMPSHKKASPFFGDRDISMLKRVNNLINIFVTPSEKAAIMEHSGHLQNMERSVGDTTLGFHLRKYYKDKYFSISFQVATGTYTQDECTPGAKTIVDTLKPPPLYSFEYAALATGISYFYYPAKYLGNGFLTYCSIPRGARYDDLYKFSPPKKQFDAYVFIKESKPIEKIEPSLLIYGINYFYTKRMEMDSVLNDLKN